MSEQEFKNRIDGLVNEYHDGVIDGKGLRGGIMDTIIELAKPRFDREPVPMFSTITSFAQFRQIVDRISDVDDLNELRNAVLNYNRNNYAHPLKEPNYRFAACFKKLNARADELHFTKYDWGYRDAKKTKNGAS